VGQDKYPSIVQLLKESTAGLPAAAKETAGFTDLTDKVFTLVCGIWKVEAMDPRSGKKLCSCFESLSSALAKAGNSEEKAVAFFDEGGAVDEHNKVLEQISRFLLSAVGLHWDLEEDEVTKSIPQYKQEVLDQLPELKASTGIKTLADFDYHKLVFRKKIKVRKGNVGITQTITSTQSVGRAQHHEHTYEESVEVENGNVGATFYC